MRKFTFFLSVIVMMANSLYAQVAIEQDLREALETSTDPVEVVVTFYGDDKPTAANVDLLTSVGITTGVTFNSLPIAGVLATLSQVDALSKSPQVRSLELNKQLDYYNYNETHLTGVQRLRADQEITSRNKGLPVSGKGIAVVVNDSGVDGTHDDIKLGSHLVQNVLGTTNLSSWSSIMPVSYMENVPNTDNNSGHGTHCAGTVGGNGAKSNGLYEGVAPGADLVGYGSGGVLFILDAVGGFDYAITHQFEYGIRVITNSWGSSGKFNPNHAVNVASKKAYDRNIVSVFAAGNSGPGADTHNPYAVAPWVISVGAGDKYGKLANFSSRGLRDDRGTFTINGETWTYENRPTVVAPGVDVVSTRVLAPLSALSVQKDATLDPEHAPYYTHMSGTSMACPHVAGIVALMLEANPSLSPMQVKQILERTATNMPNRQSWEVGGGYVNAYAAVDHIFRGTNFGTFSNMTRSFNSSVNSQFTVVPFKIDYNPLLTEGNETTFFVEEGTGSIEAKILAGGISGETGNPVNLSLISPEGKEYRSGIYVLFTIYQDRTVAVTSPMPGTWKVRISGLQGVAFPEEIYGKISFQTALGTTNLNDVVGHPAEKSIHMAVAARLVDGLSTGFKPDESLKRIQLAEYLVMGQAARQFMPTTGAATYSDVKDSQTLLVESVSANGAALRDRFHAFNGVMLPASPGKFAPSADVDRVRLAYSFVQSLGLQEQAMSLVGTTVKVDFDGKEIEISDAEDIPAGLEGYVQLALDLKLINVYYSLTQGPSDLEPTIHAYFKPLQKVTRAEFAVFVTKTHEHWTAVTTPTVSSSQDTQSTSSMSSLGAEETTTFNYPNPFSYSTTIDYVVPADGFTKVEVFNTKGERVTTLVEGEKPAGRYTVTFDAGHLPAGIYIYQVGTTNSVKTSRMVLVK